MEDSPGQVPGQRGFIEKNEGNRTWLLGELISTEARLEEKIDEIGVSPGGGY